MGGFSVCRDGRENSPQASERPWDVLFFYAITKMIDRRRNYNLSGQEQTYLSSSLCDELLFMSVARWDWNLPNKRFPLQRMEAAAAHVEAPHHFNSSRTVPFIHWLWWYVSSLDWRNGTNSSHISRSGKQIVFHDFPGEFLHFFFFVEL